MGELWFLAIFSIVILVVGAFGMGVVTLTELLTYFQQSELTVWIVLVFSIGIMVTGFSWLVGKMR